MFNHLSALKVLMSRSALSHNKVEYIFNTSFELYASIDTMVICMIWRLFLIYQHTAINQKPEFAKGGLRQPSQKF